MRCHYHEASLQVSVGWRIDILSRDHDRFGLCPIPYRLNGHAGWLYSKKYRKAGIGVGSHFVRFDLTVGKPLDPGVYGSVRRVDKQTHRTWYCDWFGNLYGDNYQTSE